MADIVVTGLSANDPIPDVYLEANFAQGAASGASALRTVLLIGNMLSTGLATADTTLYGPNTTVPCITESDVKSLFGTGSPLHRAFKRFTKINKVTPLYLMAVSESAGTQAALTITITNAATGNGTIRTFHDEGFAETSVTSGDSANTIATNLAAKLNEQVDWPFTAAASTNTVVCTARLKGPRGNTLRIQNTITAGIATTVSQTTDTPFSGGATVDSYTTALATINPKHFGYIVTEADDATNVGATVTQVNLQAAPTTGNRQRVVYGSVDTSANAITMATGRNAARAEQVWSYKSPWTPFELAAHQAAIYALEEASDSPLTNFAGYGRDERTATYWGVPAPRDVTAHPARATLVSLLNNGVTPIAADDQGKTYLVNRITTKSQTSSLPDYRIRDAHKVTITDMYSDDLVAMTKLNYSGRTIAGDPPKGKAPPGGKFVWPALYRTSVVGIIDNYVDRGLFDPDKADEMKSRLEVRRGTNPTTRMGIRSPIYTVDNFLQAAIAVDQVG